MEYNLGIYSTNVDWIKIENLNYILDQFEPPKYHPEDPRYREAWKANRKKLIEGIWVEQFGKYRYCPGRIGFYAKFCSIFDTIKKTKARKQVIPSIRDLEWHFAYYITECFGFSGFEDDDRYSGDERLLKDTSTLSISDLADISNSKGKLKEYKKPRDILFELHDKPLGRPLYNNNTKNFLVVGSRGGGKAMLETEYIYKETGYELIKNAQVGDKIYGSDGNLTTITGVYPQGITDVYEVEFKDGRKCYTNPEHLWTVNKNNKVISTIDMLEKGYKYAHKRSGFTYRYKVKQNKPVNYPKQELPIDPYILGYLLGNGALTSSTPKVATSEMEVLERFKNSFPDYDIVYDKSTNNNYTIVHRGEKINIGTKVNGTPLLQHQNLLHRDLKALGLNVGCKSKFIPDIYKYASIDQRMELVRGLMDSDGSISKGYASFSSTNETLLNDLQEVLRSLGIKSQKGIDKRTGKVHDIKGCITTRNDCWRLFITTNLPIFFISRKLERITKKNINEYTSIVSIKKMDYQAPTICISVDAKDHNFLTTNYVVTHNSYFFGLALALYELVFDSKKYADQGKSQATIDIAAGIGSKSTELMKKLIDSMHELKVDPKFGVYGKEGDDKDIFEPCPYYRNMKGDGSANTSWVHEIAASKNGVWKKLGSGSEVNHKIYSTNKKGGAQEGAGGRRNVILYEEVGLMQLLIEAWTSNTAVVTTDGEQFGIQVGIGTSGDLEMVRPAQKIFTHPKDYNCIEFDDQCFFLPAPLTDKRFKDADGNTDIQAAYEFYIKRREDAAKSSDPRVLLAERMNYPLQVDDMWLSGSTGYLPVKEAEAREKELIKDNLFEKLGTAIDLFYDSNTPTGINYSVIPKSKSNAIFNWPLQPTESTKGEFMMYISPEKLKINGQLPPDAVIVTHDPYVSDDPVKGGSLGVTYFIVNPKYLSFGLPGYQIAATYIGKHEISVDGYNDIVFKGLHFYGLQSRNLWYEANRGDKIRGYAIRKNKAHLLCLRPQFEQGQYLFKKNATQTGFNVGDRLAKITLLDGLSEILLKELPDGKRVIETIPCLFTVKQIRQYTLEGNFDGVSALLGLPLAINEQEHYAVNRSGTKVLHGLTKQLRYARH